MTCRLTKARSKRLLPTPRLAWVWEQGASEIGLRALRAVDNAATAKHPSGGALLSARLARRASKARSKLEARRQTSLHLRRGCCEALAGVGIERLLWCSCCRSVAEVGENHLSRSAVARKGNGGCVDSANRSTPRTWSWLASGEKGAERLRRREQQARGSSTRQQCRVVEPMEGALGRTSFAALTGGEESRPWQRQNVRSPTAVGRAPLDAGSGEPVTGTACDRGRQRPRYSVVLSQPKGAEGNAANGVHDVHAVLRRMLSPKLVQEPPAPTLQAEAAARTAQPAAGTEPRRRWRAQARRAQLIDGRQARQGAKSGMLR